MNGWASQERLASFRAGFPAAPLHARRLAGLLDVPGCTRRQVLDAAAVQLEPLASLLGCPPAGQSPFAITRQRQFEQLVVGDAMGAVVALAREHLAAPVQAVRQLDLSADQVRSQYVRADLEFRASLTRGYVRDMLAGRDEAINLLRHPVLALRVGGAPIYVEPDLMGYTTQVPLHPVQVRSYPCVDGVADATKVSATARETAVHLLAVRELATRLGYDPDRVGARGLLILPRNFSLTPTAATVDVTPQLHRLERMLATFPEPSTLVSRVPGLVSLPQLPDRQATADQRADASQQAAEAVSALPQQFGDGCLRCPLFHFCRSEQQSQDAVARLGDVAANECGDVATVDAALSLAHGQRHPLTVAEQAVAAQLGRAAVANHWATTTAHG